MRLIDSPALGGGPRITLDDIRATRNRYSSNPAMLSAFVAGFRPAPDLLLDRALLGAVGASGRHGFYGYVLHDLLPRIYDAHHLSTLGGRFALMLDGVGGYTITPLNRRIITLRGLPVDLTGRTIVDLSVRADVFLALFNQMLADMAEQTLQMTARAVGPCASDQTAGAIQ